MAAISEEEPGMILTPGLRALAASIVALPRHRFDVGKPNYFTNLLKRFRDVPDHILFTVASEIEELEESELLPQQPRYEHLKPMIDAASLMDDALKQLCHRPRVKLLPHNQRGRG